jgi:hypothetical protein
LERNGFEGDVKGFGLMIRRVMVEGRFCYRLGRIGLCGVLVIGGRSLDRLLSLEMTGQTSRKRRRIDDQIE